MISAVIALFGMPCVLVFVTIVGAGRLRTHPGRDDVWQLPRPSSLR